MKINWFELRRVDELLEGQLAQHDTTEGAESNRPTLPFCHPEPHSGRARLCRAGGNGRFFANSRNGWLDRVSPYRLCGSG